MNGLIAGTASSAPKPVRVKPGCSAVAHNLLDSYIYGFALQQNNLPFTTSAEIAEVAQHIVQRFPVDR